jgi:hypothetical protein
VALFGGWSIVSHHFAEPLFGRRRPQVGAADPWGPLTRSSLFEELVEALFASFDDDWSHTRRWR